MKREWAVRLFVVVLMLAASAHAQLFRFQSRCTIGGQFVQTSGLNSTNKVDASYPQCKVDVFFAGTTTRATIFSDSLGTPLGNPFNATTDATVGFWSSAGCYDVVTSSGTAPGSIMPAPYTYGAQCIGGSGGGGSGTVSVVSSDCTGASSLIACSVSNPTTTPVVTITSPLTLQGTDTKLMTAGTISGTGAGLCTDANGGATTAGCLPGGVTSVFGRTGAVTAQSGDYAVAQVTGAAPLASPTFTGVPAAPTAAPGTNTTQLATTAFVLQSGVQQVPATSQNIVQPAGTNFTSNDLAGIKYAVTSYNWSQSPAGTVVIGSNTITLNPCPAGIMYRRRVGDGIQPWTYIRVAGTGTPESVLVTSTTCTQHGGSSGTVTFTAAGAHAAGYTLGSASVGIQEAINDAMNNNAYCGSPCALHLGSAVIPPGSGVYVITAPVSVVGDYSVIDWEDAQLECQVNDACIVVGDRASSNQTNSVTMRNLTARPRIAAGTFPFVEDSGQGTKIDGLSPLNRLNAEPTASFGYLIQVDDDEAAVIDHISIPGNFNWARCDTTFCSTAVYNPSGKTGIVWLDHANLSLQCAANAIDLRGGNTGHAVTNSVVQGYPQFGIRVSTTFAPSPELTLSNVTQEIGSCTNPVGIGTSGVIALDGWISVKGSTFAGNAPLFANTGGTTYRYWIVVKTSTGKNSAPLYAGRAATNGVGNITVKWNQIGATGTVTYDVIRSSGAIDSSQTPEYPYTAICTGGSTTTCGSVATGLTVGANCSAVGSWNICSFVDDASLSTSSYTVLTSNYDGGIGIPFWPANFLTGSSFDRIGSSPRQNASTFDVWGENINSSNTTLSISGFGTVVPGVSALICSGTGNVSGTVPGFPAYCFDNENAGGPGGSLFSNTVGGSAVVGLKGRIILENGPDGRINGSHVITLMDSNSAKTFSSGNKRPAWDAADAYIGFDNPGLAGPTSTQVSIGAPVSISSYINNVGDNTSWLERLTSTVKTFRLPVQFNGSTSGSAQIGVAAVAGTPNKINLPIATGAAGAVLQTDGANPQQASWVLPTRPFDCGTTSTCANTALTNFHIIIGQATLVSGTPSTVTVTGISPTFTSSSSYRCVCNNQTVANSCIAVPATGTSVTITGPNTVTDTVVYQCMGN